MKRLSADSHSFAFTPTINTPRSVFNRDSTYKTCFDIGWLIPYFWDEVYPGDTFKLKTTAFIRLATPKFPLMDQMYVDYHAFFIPNRIIWDNWRKFCGERVDPSDSIDFTIPVLSGSTPSDNDAVLSTIGARRQALLNYMGVPDGIAPDDVDINALPFRAYGAIYDHWYRDQNLIDSIGIQTDDGPDSMGSEVPPLMQRGKRHDYFTSCLPWPQKPDTTWGTGGVTLPLGTVAPITGIGVEHSDAVGSSASVRETGGSSPETYTDHWTSTSKAIIVEEEGTTNYPGIYADLTNATAATINDLLEAFSVQDLLVRDAMSGTRYPEIILNHFGVSGFYDASYRPEYLGGGSSVINISPIAQTAMTASGGSVGVGDLAAIGTSIGNLNINKTFTEHGILMCIVSVRNDLHYQQGLRREFSRSTRYDYYWPALSNLGMQPVYNKEIYVDGTSNDDLVFGYQNRYDELRYRQSMITNIFQSAAAASLEAWHLADDYASLPTLGETFINVNTDLDRCVQVPSEPHFIFDSLTELRCARPMPANAIPGLKSHF